MGLNVIMKLKGEIEEPLDLSGQSDFDRPLTDDVEKDKDIIKLTDFTITKYNRRLDKIGGKNEYLSRDIMGIELYGQVNLYDKSKEVLEINKLSEWTKKTAHEEVSYRDVLVELTDNNNQVYDTIHIKEGFIVKYHESFDMKKGNGEFYVFIREFNTEEFAAKKQVKTGTFMDVNSAMNNPTVVSVVPMVGAITLDANKDYSATNATNHLTGERFIKENKVPVKNGDGSQYDTIGTLNIGDKVELADGVNVSADEKWIKIKYNDGNGWVERKYFTSNAPKLNKDQYNNYIVTNGYGTLNVLSMSNPSSSLLYTVSTDSTIPVVYHDNGEPIIENGFYKVYREENGVSEYGWLYGGDSGALLTKDNEPEWGCPINFSGETIYDTISSGFGNRVLNNKTELHPGIDFTGKKVVNYDIMAVKDGVVIASHFGASGTGIGYGEVIVIKHDDGSGYTMYAHLSERKVAKDSHVERKQVIGIMGNTGTSYGVHLHFGYYKNWPNSSPFYEPANPATNPTDFWK